jgi:hypothetical protein
MATTSTLHPRSPLDRLAGVNERCERYGPAAPRGHPQNLTVRKVYGKDQLRYLRCRVCRAEFSERKRTALWNSKIREGKAVAVAEHLAEGCSLKGTARLVKVDASTVRRLNQAWANTDKPSTRSECQPLRWQHWRQTSATATPPTKRQPLGKQN